MELTVVLVIVVLAVALGALAAFALRRRLIQRPGATFDCSARLTEPGTLVLDQSGKGWHYGIARYNRDAVEWFRVFSYAPRPRRVLERSLIEVVERRTPQGQEELALLSGAVVLSCMHGDTPLELAMSEDALTGFLAWLEAAPPGQRVNVA